MFEFTAHEIENLIDLVEIKMLAMCGGNFPDESETACLESCRTKLLIIAEDMPEVMLIPFDEALAN